VIIKTMVILYEGNPYKATHLFKAGFSSGNKGFEQWWPVGLRPDDFVYTAR
jgi:hypothetical protein